MFYLRLVFLCAVCTRTKAFYKHEIDYTKLKDLDRALSIATRDIQHLNLLLRSNNLYVDAESAYTRWFLHNNNFLLYIDSYDATDLTDDASELKVDANRESFVIVTSMMYLHSATKRFVQRAGVFFFIIIDEIQVEKLRDILFEIWTQYNAFKNYILTLERVLIYDPFEFNVIERNYGKIISYKGEQDLEQTLFRDMRGYPLRIQIFKSVYARPILDKETKKIRRVDGVDSKVAKLLQERINFTLNLQEPDPDYFGERAVNGTYNGAIGSIINNEIDMCLTGFFVKDYMVPEMTFSVAVYDDQLCIYVPKARRIPQSILPIFSVRYDLWLGFILTAFMCASVWVIMRRINLWLGIKNLNDAHVGKNLKLQFLRIYIDTWVVWVRVNIVRYPPFHSERIFIASLCLVSVIFGAIFESSLATVYIHPLYYRDINTLRELDESGLKIIYKYSSMADDLFFNETSPLFASLNKKLTHLSDLNADVILDIANNARHNAGVTRYSSLMLESFHFIISKRVWIVPECPKYYTISYVMPKDSPWEETINGLLLRFLNAGLIKKWISEMQTQADIKIMKDQQFTSSDTFKVLTIIDLQLAFYVVLIGNLFAGISLIGEKYIKARSTLRKNMKKQHSQV